MTMTTDIKASVDRLKSYGEKCTFCRKPGIASISIKQKDKTTCSCDSKKCKKRLDKMVPLLKKTAKCVMCGEAVNPDYTYTLLDDTFKVELILLMCSDACYRSRQKEDRKELKDTLFKTCSCGKQMFFKDGGYQYCGKCMEQAYCSRECQVKFWSTHKEECKRIRTAKEKAKKEDDVVVEVRQEMVYDEDVD